MPIDYLVQWTGDGSAADRVIALAFPARAVVVVGYLVTDFGQTVILVWLNGLAFTATPGGASNPQMTTDIRPDPGGFIVAASANQLSWRYTAVVWS